ncbi:MAG: hypothetical protein FWC64_03585 [Treponema sp.]|nr:hypothetical protein [Treponema sp.]
MANDKKPSIYLDRGTIGSHDELDEYGVWVKSEPQDVSLAGMEAVGMPEFSGELTENLSEEASGMDDLDIDAFALAEDDNFELPDLGEVDEEILLADENIDFEDFDEQEPDGFGETDGIDDGDDDALVDMTGQLSLELPDDETSDFDPDDEEGFDEISMEELIGPLGVDTDTEGDALPELPDDEFAMIDDAGIDDTSEPFAAFGNQSAGDEDPSLALSTQLLMKIADELSSIRSELSSLKREFAATGAAHLPSAAEEDEKIALTGDELSTIINIAPPPPEPEMEMDPEEDEKIALTGDELSNILSTADFTDETGADAAMENIETFEDIGIQEEGEDIGTDFTPIDLDMDMDMNIDMDMDAETSVAPPPAEVSGEDEVGIDIFLDSSDYFESAEPVELTESVELSDFDLSMDSVDDEESDPALDIPSGDAPAEFAPDFAASETEELNQILEDGVQPITFAPDPDDATYLTEDPFSEGAGEPIDLSGAVIDEPDLSLDIHENPIEEPLPEDISIDLDTDTEQAIDFESEIGIEAFDEALEEIDEGIEFSMDMPDDMPDFPSAEPASELVEEEIPAMSFETAKPADGGDLSLIPEGFAMDSLEQDSPESDSVELFFDTGDDDTISMDDIDNFVTGAEETVDEADEIVDLQDDPQALPAATELPAEGSEEIPSHLKKELKTVLSYMDRLLESLPDDKIEEFAKSDHYETYKKLFRELGLV